ncbi:MAG: Gfo/Idh/MocA family oxidoreductase [Phycisphaeraceae bacterium]|nr:Gfo/Idh/MocA family oxidoreductase [Phycisphaeraceae bacterium]
MQEVRLGVIGCGQMAMHHMGYFSKIARLKFTAASDTDPERVKKVVDTYNVKGFDDGMKVIDPNLVDAVLIATPHYFHPQYAIAAMEKGIHVLTEKPVAVTAKAAEKMNEAHRKFNKTIYAIMFQSRTFPVWKKAKQIIDSGELGKLQRVTWIVTNWFRSQAYYDSGTWRATWAGEGGGVLINQCPHNLDLLTWLVGVPKLVSANVRLGHYHHIEVEDDVNAYLEFPDGATGNFITTTGEAPGTDLLEIAGDWGKLVITGNSNKIELHKNHVAAAEFCRTTKEMWATPGRDKVTIEVGGSSTHHQAITENFVAAVLDGEKLIAPGEDGIKGLELGNAMLMSGLLNKPIAIPTDRDAFEKLINDLSAKSKFQKGAVKKTVADMAGSFR